MKKNIFLFCFLIVLLSLTYYFVEFLPGKKLKEQQSWMTKVDQAHSITLLKTKFKETPLGWIDQEGLKLKNEFLLEFTQMVRSFVFLEVLSIDSKDNYFHEPADVTIDQVTITIGDRTPSGNKFYMKRSNDLNVYLMDLELIPSKVMGETDEKLNLNKWTRLRDFIFATPSDWQEKHVHFYADIGAFDEMRVNDYPLKLNVSVSGEKGFAQQFKDRLFELQWENINTTKIDISGIKITFWLNNVLKNTWIMTKDKKILLENSGKVVEVLSSSWDQLFTPYYNVSFPSTDSYKKINEIKEAIWSPFDLCSFSKKVKNPNCQAGFVVTPK